MSWYVYFPHLESYGNLFDLNPNYFWTKLIIDVNGFSKGPNCSADPSFNGAYDVANGTPYLVPKNALGTDMYSSCISTDTVNAPCQKNPDTFVVGVRYDGKLQVGSGTPDPDACATSILSNPTSIK